MLFIVILIYQFFFGYLKNFPCVLKQRRTHLSAQWRYSQTAAGKSFVPVNGMKQMKIQPAWPWATITTVLMTHGTQNVAMLQRCPPTTTAPFPPDVKTTWKRNNNFAKVIMNFTHVIST